MVRILAFIFVLCSGLFVNVAEPSAAVTATVNTTDVVEGATLQLILKTDSEPIHEPQLEGLQKNFVITGRQQSYQKSIVNGRLRAEKTWIFNLIPNKVGKVTIPAIRMGNEKTKPIEINVTKATSRAGSGSGSSSSSSSGSGVTTVTSQIPTGTNAPAVRGRQSAQTAQQGSGVDVFIEGSVENKNPYVQSQVVYVARLYSATKLEQGTWPPPAVVDALIEPLGDDIYFQDSRKGRIYNVVERRYVIFPQKSGRLEIPPSEFVGTVFSGPQGTRGLNNVMMSFGFGAAGTVLGGFGATESLKVRSDPVVINVLPKPSDFNGKWWLPAYNLKLSEKFEPSPVSFKVNEAVTRTITIEATGLLAAQLPDISFGSVSGVRVYPGKAEKSNRVTDKGIVGKVEKSEVLIPLTGGELVIPEITIKWWNVASRRVETATIPERKVMVEGSLSTQNPAVADASGSSDIAQKVEEENPSSKKSFWNLRNSVLVGMIVLLSVVLVVLMYLLFKKQKPSVLLKEAEKSKRQYFKDLEEAVKSEKDNPKEVADALMKWGRKHWEENPPINVTAIADKLKSSELKKELEELNQSIYAKGQKNNFDKDKLLAVLKRALDAKMKQDKQVKPVPDLYPM